MTDVYFVTSGISEEVQVIKKLRPAHLLCSYWYFKSVPMSLFVERLGYRPEIMLDSGAYSAFTKKKNVNLLDYMEYIKQNAEYISRYVTLDVIGDSEMTKLIYSVMVKAGLNPIPVIHYGENINDVKFYVDVGADKIALGGTVKIKDKSVVSKWCDEIHENFPDIPLHLLGSCSSKILKNNSLSSCDSCSWYLMAVNGKPSYIHGNTREAKIARAEANMVKIMEVFCENPVSFNDCHIKYSNGQV